jgi:putative redox protein
MTESKKVTVTLRGGMAFDGLDANDHKVELDAPPKVGGEDAGFSPMALVLVALGGCTGMDVISILRKMRQDVSGYRVEVSGTQREEHPRIYTQIHVEHVLQGQSLDPRQVARAVELSATRYCPVSSMLSSDETKVEHTYRIEQAGDYAAS